jgi:hypothetical protein
MNILKHANGANDICTVSVFAWAEDVSLSVLTSRDVVELSAQSGEEIDEANAMGVVSGPATVVAKASAYFMNIPYVAPFAMATNMAATTTAAIAKMFGYSRPPITKAPDPYRPTLNGSLALTNVPDVVEKMTIDSKQELTIDPRISGLGGVDPLNIREIAKRESYLTTFSWVRGTEPEALLWNARVSPVIWNEITSTPRSYVFPACCFAAMPFQYWTGTMKFRFQIVASAYHRGRIKVVYDPEYLAQDEYNTNYMRIVDISEEQDFTIEVSPSETVQLMKHEDPGYDSYTQTWSSTRYTDKAFGNGVIGFFVVNELTVPNSTANNDIEVNVFVSMGDDFEVFVPEDRFQAFTLFPPPQAPPPTREFTPQSGAVAPTVQETSEPSAPQQSMSDHIGIDANPGSKLNTVFTGESITSFRTLLKRYNLWSAIVPTNDYTSVIGRTPAMPYPRGYAPNAVDLDLAGESYNYCNTVLLHWVRYAFMGWRGSIRYKLIPRGVRDDQVYHISAQRSSITKNAPGYRYETAPLENYTSVKSGRRSVMWDNDDNGKPISYAPFSGANGQVISNGGVNPSLSFEVPYYNQVRFSPGRQSDMITGQNSSPGFDYRVEVGGTSSGAPASGVIDMHVAAGEDFQVYFFAGLPRMYFENQVPE